MSKFTQYFKDTKSEMKHVTWPTRRQVINFTLIVIGVSLITSALLGLFDFIFTTGLSKLLGQ